MTSRDVQKGAEGIAGSLASFLEGSATYNSLFLSTGAVVVPFNLLVAQLLCKLIGQDTSPIGFPPLLGDFTCLGHDLFDERSKLEMHK